MLTFIVVIPPIFLAAIKFTSSGSIRIQAECVRNGGPVVSTVTVPSKVVGRASRGYAQTHSHVELNVMDSAASPAAVSPSDHGAMASVLVRISVIDSGVGLSEADQALLFCPYRQVSLGKLQKGTATLLSSLRFRLSSHFAVCFVTDKGSGLGLAICKRLVELHGGTVGCKSGLGLGSQFYFEVPLSVLPPGRAHSSVVNVQHDLTLPYALHRLPSTSPRRSSGQSALEVNRTELTEAKLDDKVPALTTDVPSLSASASNVSIVTPTVTASPPSALIAEAAACRKRILVVEDTDVNRRLLVGLLVRLGYDAVGVEHGQMCVDLFQEWRNEAKSGEAFDMVLMYGCVRFSVAISWIQAC